MVGSYLSEKQIRTRRHEAGICQALFSNGTSGLYFRGDTVTIDAKALNVTVISGQDYAAQIETAPGTFETVEVYFD